MSKAKEYRDQYTMHKQLTIRLDEMNHKTLEDVADIIHDSYTEEWSDEVGLFIDNILMKFQSVKL